MTGYLILLKEGCDTVFNNGFHDLTWHWSERNWSIVIWICFVTLKKNRYDVCRLPVRWQNSRLKWFLEHNGKWLCNWSCTGNKYHWMESIRSWRSINFHPLKLVEDFAAIKADILDSRAICDANSGVAWVKRWLSYKDFLILILQCSSCLIISSG